MTDREDTTALEEFLATDRALVDRMKQFLGHIEDMGDDERLFMLGALHGALERHLAAPREIRAGSVIKDPEAGDFVTLSGKILSVHEGTALVEVYRSDPAGIRVAVQCGALEHVEPAADGDMAPGHG